MEAKITENVRVRRRRATFELQMRENVVPKPGAGICSREIWDRICKSAIELRFDTVAGRHALVETMPESDHPYRDEACSYISLDHGASLLGSDLTVSSPPITSCPIR